MQYYEGTGVQHLIDRGAIILVLYADPILIKLILRGFQGIRHLRGQRGLQLMVHVVQIDLFVLLEQLLLLLLADG